ncbi:MAG: PAS domain S-box protein [Thermoanaerobaculia bacterium]|jgi:PAS domain S-box-containing protein
MEESVSALTPVITAAIGALLAWLLLRRRSVEEQSSKEPAPTAASARREQMFKKAFDTAPVGMAVITPQGQWLQVNGRLLKLLGYSREEILRTSMRELTHSDDRKLEAPHARKLMSREIASYTLDKRLMRRGRQYGLYSVSFSRFQRSDDTAEELWLCVIEEAKHSAEVERVEQASAVEALLGEMREIAVISYDPQGIIQSWNAGAERVFGLPAKDMLGRSRTVLYRESDVWEEKPRNDLRIALSNRRFDADDWRLGKDGINLWLKVSILPDVRGDEIVRFVEICRESGQTRGVDEYRQSYERLKRASEGRIEELNSTLRELQGEVQKKEKQTEALREALESFRQTGEEQMAELKILTEAFRKEMDRRRDIEDQLRASTAERDEIAQRFESAERELREREVVATNVPAEAEWSSLAHVPPADLFIALAKDRRTGTLLVSSVSVEKKVFLEDGLIFSCMSNDPALFLGQILLREGIINAEQHRHAVELHEETGIALGRILVMSGAIDQGALTRAMRVKVEEEIVSIFDWDEGEFTFIEGDPPSLQLVPVRLEIPPIVVRGLRRAGRVDDAKAVERRLAQSDLGATPASAPATHDDWGEQAEAGISEIHLELPAAKPEAPAAPASEEDLLVEQVIAEAEQAVLELAGLRHEVPPDETAQIGVAEPHPAGSAVAGAIGDETVAVLLARTSDAGEETMAASRQAVALEDEISIEIEDVGDETVAIRPKPVEEIAEAVVDRPERATEETTPASGVEPSLSRGEFVASTAKKSTKYHRPGCTSVANIAEDARAWFATRADAEAAGLQACKLCRKK